MDSNNNYARVKENSSLADHETTDASSGGVRYILHDEIGHPSTAELYAEVIMKHNCGMH